MTKYPVETIRNIAFCGHGGSGKTTLADKILMMTGAVNRDASVDAGTSICDFDEEEKHHKYSVESSVVHFDHAGQHFDLIDTPGYPDFLGQCIGALHAVGTAAIVIDAHAGIGVNTRRVFKEANDLGLGMMIIINKMDADNINFPQLIANIQELFGTECIPLNVPRGCGHDFKGVISTLKVPEDISGALLDPHKINTDLMEHIVEVDEEATEKYFEGELPSEEETVRLIDEAEVQHHVVPIVCVSAKTGVGMKELLDALAVCTLPPGMVGRTARKDGQEIQLKADAKAPLVARVFKTRVDPFVQKLSYLRVYSGVLKSGETVHVSGVKKNIKMGQLLNVQASETHPVDEAGPGDIVAVAKMEDLHTGTSIGEYELPPMKFPTPMVSLAVTPKARGDEAKLSGALHKIVEEDPTFHLDRDPQTHELVMTGMSELHLQLVREKLKRRDKVEVDTKEPKIPYKETIQQEAEGSYRHKKQSGGRGQFGEVHIRMYPMPTGTNIEEFVTKQRFPQMREFHIDQKNNFVWVDSIVGGSIPNNFLPAIEKGFKERMERGVIAGYHVQNLAVEVFYGKHHPVDSSEAAFKTAGSMAFRNVFQQAKPALLEPIVNLHVTVPSGKLGDINSDMSTRRGRVMGMESAGGDLQTVTAQVPLAEVTTYARSLSSITGGLGSYNMEFSHYDLVPGNVQREIMDKAVMKEEEEE